uniref:Fe2OG dioxygenase domain-containing protein n=1 Tax=Lotharella globosa TaxID=91324 RepID=A0A7S3YI44_9EUKA
MSILGLLAPLALLLSAETVSDDHQCTADGECELDSGRITVTVFNNGVNDAGVPIEIDPTMDLTSIADMMAETIKAEDTLLPHQRTGDYGFGKPWKLYKDSGDKISSIDEFENDGKVYVVPNELHFMWPTVELNHTVVLTDIPTTNNLPVKLRTLNHSPKVFEIENLLTPEEAEALREAAMHVEHAGNKFQRSTTGHTGNVDPFRTSDNAFVHSESPIAVNLTKRAFQVLRMEYDSELGDGIQVLRYNASGGYRWHTDWFPETTVYGRNHDVTRGGANRFATVFFYLSDVGLGGQTGFPEAEGDTSELESSLEKAREMFKPRSWELEAVEKCFGKFSVKPFKARAILFYSLHPNGKGDPMSMHTGCPVLEGQKWAANLWIWNKRRDPERGERKKIEATFINTMDEPCLVSWVTNPRHVQGRIDPGKQMHMSTYDSDSFVFRDLDRVKVLAKWTAYESNGLKQVVRLRKGMDDFQDTTFDATEPKAGEVHIQLINGLDHKIVSTPCTPRPNLLHHIDDSRRSQQRRIKPRNHKRRTH